MKHIVICADGTWNRPEEDLSKDYPTNVLKMARAIAPVSAGGTEQVVFYDWGLGSYHDGFKAGAFGSGINKNIQDCYRFLVHNYCPLMFLESSGRNRTPDKLPVGFRAELESACDRALVRTYERKYAEADSLFQAAIHTFEDSVAPKHPELAEFWSNYADLLSRMGRGQDARQADQKAASMKSP